MYISWLSSPWKNRICPFGYRRSTNSDSTHSRSFSSISPRKKGVSNTDKYMILPLLISHLDERIVISHYITPKSGNPWTRFAQWENHQNGCLWSVPSRG